jgi:MFS family permease
MTDSPGSNYKWYILALGAATHIFVLAMPWMCMPVLFKEISDDLGLDLVQVGTVWGMLGLAGMFTALFAGLIGDRYGTRKTLTVICLLLGIAGALRGLSENFIQLAVFMFLFGLFSVNVTLAVHKSAGEWFTGRQLGLANGVLAMGIGLGFTLATMFSATVFSPLLGGWHNLMFVYGAVSVIVGIFWFQTRRSPAYAETSTSIETVSFRRSLAHVVRLRDIWLLGIVDICVFGCRTGLVGYLPLYLRDVGWEAVRADGAVAALSAASVLGVIPLSLLSDKIGLRKTIVYPSIIMIIIGVGFLAFVNGVLIWPLVILIGISVESLAAVLITMVMETAGRGGTYAGTALGLATTLALTGNFIAPPVGNRLAVINPSFAFIFWASMALVGLVLFFFVRETGWKKSVMLLEDKDTVIV